MKKTLFIAAASLALFLIIVALWIRHSLSDMPDVAALKRYRPAAASEILDKDGNVLAHFNDKSSRIWVPVSSLPDIVIKAVVTAEDDTFFAHKGVNYKATWDALVHDVKKRRFARGGSTITQQMIKNVLLSKEKTLSRKVREYVLARKAEELLTKRRILEIYLNEVEWGETIHGIEAASRLYFGKRATELNVSEAALLAGMLPNPRYYNPFKRLHKARARQQRVLKNLRGAQLITKAEYAAAREAPLVLRQEGADDERRALFGDQEKPCYHRALEQALLALYGEQVLYRSGRTIRTTLDKNLQEEVNRGQNRGDALVEALSVIKEGEQIRAFVCGEGREEELRTMFASGFSPGPGQGYDVRSLSPRSLTRDELILPKSLD